MWKAVSRSDRKVQMCKWRIKFWDSDYIGCDVQRQTRSEFKDMSLALAWRKVFFSPSGCDQWGGEGDCWHNWISVKVQFRSWNIHQQYWKECTSVGWFILSSKMVIQLPACLRRPRGKYHFGTKRSLSLIMLKAVRLQKGGLHRGEIWIYISWLYVKYFSNILYPILSQANWQLFMFLLAEPRKRKVVNYSSF